MNKYLSYSIPLIVGGMLLGLAGCGSSNNGNCSNGQVNSQYGCEDSCTYAGNISGVMYNGSCVQNTVASASGYNCSMYPGYTQQAVPAQYASMFAQSGGQACCPPNVNLSTITSNPYGYGYGYGSGGSLMGCVPASNYTYGQSGSVINGGNCTLQGGYPGIYENGVCV